MDLGEKADLCDYEKIHRMIEATYKNILKNFNPGVKQLIVLGKALQKTIQNVGTSFKAYNECLSELARSAESCKGSTKELALYVDGNIPKKELKELRRSVHDKLYASKVKENRIKVFHAELLIPLKAKQETEFRHVQVIYDKYLAGHKYHSNNLRKAQNALEKCKKKTKSKSGQKEMEKTRHMKECKRKLEEYLRKNLRLALLEERKRYCYLFNRLLCVVEDRVSKYTKANEMLMEGLRNWPELCRSPHILPSTTEQVIHDFGFSDDSCDLEDEPSGDHGDARVNSRPLKHDSLPGYDWTTRNTSSASAALAAIDEMQRKHSVTLNPTRHMFESNAQEAKTPPTPGVLCAVYPYAAATETQLSLETNDVIRVHGDVQNGWLFGRNIRTNKEGWFPLSFTDFNEELLQWKSAHMRNSSLTSLRNTWHTEPGYDLDRRPSRCSESDASDAASAAAVVAAETVRSARVSAPGVTRPMSYTVSASTADTADHNQLVRSKPLSRRMFALEPISENIPPPEEFRDRGYQVNIADNAVTTAEEATHVSLAEEQTAAEGKAVKQTKSDVTAAEDATETQTTSDANAAGHQSGFIVRRSTNELLAENELTLSVDGGGCFILHQVELVTFPPPPPSPLPPLPSLPLLSPSSTTCSKPPRYTNDSGATPVHASTSVSLGMGSYCVTNPDGSVHTNEGIDEGNAAGVNEGNNGLVSDPGNSIGSNTGVRQGQSAGLSQAPAQPRGNAGHTDSSAVNQPPPPHRPPPPPPPLPLGSYHSIRGEHFARPRLRKTLSMDSTKLN